jgi:hypothetical protein
MQRRRARPTRYHPRSSVYTGRAFAVVARVDASGVVAAAIRSRATVILRCSVNELGLPAESFFWRTAPRRDAVGREEEAHGEAHSDLRIRK